MLSVREHAPDLHEQRARYYNKLLRRWRKRLLIPPRWSMRLSISCPEEMPDAQGCCSWRYLPNAQFRIVLSCALSDELAEWIVAHELLEALTSSYAQLYEQSLEALEKEDISLQMLDLMRSQHGDVRNDIIEWMLRILLKRERPETWDTLDETLAS